METNLSFNQRSSDVVECNSEDAVSSDCVLNWVTYACLNLPSIVSQMQLSPAGVGVDGPVADHSIRVDVVDSRVPDAIALI